MLRKNLSQINNVSVLKSYIFSRHISSRFVYIFLLCLNFHKLSHKIRVTTNCNVNSRFLTYCIKELMWFNKKEQNVANSVYFCNFSVIFLIFRNVECYSAIDCIDCIGALGGWSTTTTLKVKLKLELEIKKSDIRNQIF